MLASVVESQVRRSEAPMVPSSGAGIYTMSSGQLSSLLPVKPSGTHWSGSSDRDGGHGEHGDSSSHDGGESEDVQSEDHVVQRRGLTTGKRLRVSVVRSR